MMNPFLSCTVPQRGIDGFGLVHRAKKMAANGARRTLHFTSASAKTLLTRSSAAAPCPSKVSSLGGLSSPKPTSSHLFSVNKSTPNRLAVLGGALSLMPLHSATASALSTSLLSLHNNNWGCLSEGFATPL